jgi:transposase-like protein
MTSRTNHRSAGRNQKESARPSPSALQRRRQEALERYLSGDPIEVICWEMGCSKSWLYKWKTRYQVTEPDWVQEHSRRPETTPTKTPDVLEAEIIRLRRTLSPDGSGTASADVIRDYLRQHGGDSIPSRRTIYRILKRQAKEVNAPSFPS